MAHLETDYDVVIVGAGPAGLSTALHLADDAPALAKRCAVLEAKRHPREKPCAGGLTSGALHFMRRLGIDPGSVPMAPVRDVRVRMGSREAVVRGDPHCFHVVKRSSFDEMLASALAERPSPALFQDTPVRGVRARNGGFEVETARGSLLCRAVVAADGSTSVVRKCVFPDDSRDSVVGLQLLVPSTGVADSDAVFDFTPMRSGITGYFWDFPTLGEERSVGLFAHTDVRTASTHLRDLIDTRFGPDVASVPFQAAKVRIFRPSAALSAPGALLVGDTAGIDPLFGEGIGLALGQGEVAARELIHGFSTGDLRFADYRRHLLGHRVGRCLKMRHRRFRILAAPRSHVFLRPIWRLVVSVGEMADFTPA